MITILTIVVSAILTLVIFALMLYLTFKATVVRRLQNTLHQQMSQIEQHYQTLQKQQQQLDIDFDQLQQEDSRVKEEKRIVDDLIKENNNVWNQNQLCLYNIKESSINILNDYKFMARLFSKGLNDEIPYDQLVKQLDLIYRKMNSVEAAFSGTFGQTPRQYLHSKGKIVGTGFSLN